MCPGYEAPVLDNSLLLIVFVISFLPDRTLAMSKRIQTLLKPNIFSPDSCTDRASNLSGERFKKNAVSVSEFTGFVWTEGRFV